MFINEYEKIMNNLLAIEWDRIKKEHKGLAKADIIKKSFRFDEDYIVAETVNDSSGGMCNINISIPKSAIEMEFFKTHKLKYTVLNLGV